MRPRHLLVRLADPGMPLEGLDGVSSPRGPISARMRACVARLLDTRTHCFDAISTSLATVFMLRAVPVLAAGIRSFERPIPLP